MSEIGRNPVPSDDSLLLPPTPAIDTQISTVMRDDRVVFARLKHSNHLAPTKTMNSCKNVVSLPS